MPQNSILPTVLLGAASGARSMSGLAATARVLAAPRVAGGAAALAAMELVADKLPLIPNRTDPGPLLGRIVAGALVGVAIAAASGKDRARGAAVGAAAAFVGAHVSFIFRRELAEFLPPTAAALVEDAAVGAIAAAGANAAREVSTIETSLRSRP